MSKFRGMYETTVDQKGRTSLPARYRDGLVATDDNRMVVTFSLDPCILVYTYTGWLEFEKKLAALSDFDKHTVGFKRRFIGRAVECVVDGHGRILIPPPHRTYAGISRHVVWSGALDFAELWDKARFDEMDRDDVANIEKMREALVRQGL